MRTGFFVRSVLSDAYGTIEDTLTTGQRSACREALAGKVEQYAGSLWRLTAHSDDMAEFEHTESGAGLRVSVEWGVLPTATRV